ncbi:guanylate kinase-like [Sycon ciliatum]|uniref:guanylate kinase-like n=1 Tax=Sycon ciliatum TaxID=27933 RepID=UPI0020A985FA|eukprot:scpid99470/ scgid24504/ Guanylate kinase; GMP kinase
MFLRGVSRRASQNACGCRYLSSTPKPLVVAGPSGSGKSTLLRKLMSEYPDEFGFSISHTTRVGRLGETDGVDYHFTSRESMEAGISRGEFIETAEFSGNLYGTSIQSVSDVTEKGRVCLLDIDMQGVRSVKKTQLDPAYVLVKVPSEEELERRLRARGTETPESLTFRLNAAKAELEYALQPGVFDHVVINGDLRTAYADFVAVIQSVYPQLELSKS